MSLYLPNIHISYATSYSISEKSFNTPIIIATIGTFDRFQSLIDFSQLEIVIIDEIDTIIIREDYRNILLNLIDNLSLINHYQIVVYSSTLSEQIMNYTSELIPNSIVIKQKSDKQQLLNIEQYYIRCQNQNQKNQFVNIIIQHFLNTQIMIFCVDDQTTEQLYHNIISHYSNKYVLFFLISYEFIFFFFCT